MNKTCLIGLLSLLQRERIKVRDYSAHDFPVPTKSFQARCRVPRELDDSRNGQRQFLVQLEISRVSYRGSRAGGNRAPTHPTRSRASRPDNRNPGRRDRWDVVAGIYKPQTFDFEDVAREYLRNRSRFCANTGRGSSTLYLILSISSEKNNRRPSPQSSPRTRGEEDSSYPVEGIWFRNRRQ
jgi:hypothetical protein